MTIPHHPSCRSVDHTICPFSCLNSYRSTALGFCILSFVTVFAVLRLLSSGLFLGGPGHQRRRSVVEVLVGSRSRLWLSGFRLVLGSVFDHVLGFLLVLVPFVRGWRVGVRASRSAYSTSVGLSYVSPIAQTRERN